MYEDCQGVNLPPPSFCHERRECAFGTGNGKIYISKRSFEFQSKIGGEGKEGDAKEGEIVLSVFGRRLFTGCRLME